VVKQTRLDRAFFGLKTEEQVAEEERARKAKKDQRRTVEAPLWVVVVGSILIPLLAVGVTQRGVEIGVDSQREVNSEAIAAERERLIDQFRLDQKQEQYSAIRQQATRLENVRDFSTASVAAGFGLGGLLSQVGQGMGAVLRGIPETGRSWEAGTPTAGAVGGYTTSSEIPALAGIRSGGNSWEEAYTALDQAISNAEIAGSDNVLNLARALRDKYRSDYRQSILENVDALLAGYPDPKPDREKFADALVGVPAETSSPTYDVALLKKSTDELTAMYVDAAKVELELRRLPRRQYRCPREGCDNRKDRAFTHCSGICELLDAEFGRMIKAVHRCEEYDVDGVAEVWALLVEAADAWSVYRTASAEIGRRVHIAAREACTHSTAFDGAVGSPSKTVALQ
jgi:hypothetical protein